MNEKIGAALRSRIESGNSVDSLDVSIFLKDQPAPLDLTALNLEGKPETRASRMSRLQAKAAASQSDLLSYLESTGSQSVLLTETVAPQRARIKDKLWINNSVSAEVSLEVLEEILQRPDVIHVELNLRVDLNDLLDGSEEAFCANSALGAASATPSTDVVTFDHEGDTGPETETPTNAIAKPTASVALIRAPEMWKIGLTGAGVLVAVIDAGVNYHHPDLSGHMWDGGPDYPCHGYDFINDDTDPVENDGTYFGHGTACAGIVAGNGTSGSSTGVAREAIIMAIRSGNTEPGIWRAVQFAIEHNADVISMALSWKPPKGPDYPGWRRLCESILEAGVLHANSIGNNGDALGSVPVPNNIGAPGNCPPPALHHLQQKKGGVSSAISCGATYAADQLDPRSGRGPVVWDVDPYADYPYGPPSEPGLIKPDLCAPGPTTSCNFEYPGQPGAEPYTALGGTSSATAHVGGCLALLAQACQRSGKPIVPELIQKALEESAVPISGQTVAKENHYGAGRVDIYAAFEYGVKQGWWN